MKKFSLIALILCTVCFFVWCEDDSSSEDTYTYMLIVQAEAGGVNAYAKLVASDDECDGPARYFGSALVESGEGTIVVNGIKKGDYNGCVFIDLDGNAAGDKTSLPDACDLYSFSDVPFTIDKDDAIVLGDDDWEIFGGCIE